jgi:hypothetical protein
MKRADAQKSFNFCRFFDGFSLAGFEIRALKKRTFRSVPVFVP